MILTTEGRESKARRLFTFLGSAALVAVLGYGFFGYLMTSSMSPLVLAAWTKGYLGDPTYGRHLHLDELPVAMSTLAGAVIHHPAGRAASVVRDGLLVILLLLTLRGIIPRNPVGRSLRLLAAAALFNCAVGSMLIWWWEPYNDKFWLLTLIPWLLILACSNRSSSDSAARWSIGVRTLLPPVPAAARRRRSSVQLPLGDTAGRGTESRKTERAEHMGAALETGRCADSDE